MIEVFLNLRVGEYLDFVLLRPQFSEINKIIY